MDWTDGVLIDDDGRQTILVGRGNRGPLAAVYTYLESVLGCHWPEPGQEFVPKRPDWKPSTIHLVVNPPFAWRGIAIHGACGKEYFALLVDWLAKNRTKPCAHVAARLRKLNDVADYIDLWFQVQCDHQRFSVEKSPELQKRILANIDHALKLDVVRGDDACGYGTANGVLNQIRTAVAASVPKP
jgi:hypothetical protein